MKDGLLLDLYVRYNKPNRNDKIEEGLVLMNIIQREISNIAYNA